MVKLDTVKTAHGIVLYGEGIDKISKKSYKALGGSYSKTLQGIIFKIANEDEVLKLGERAGKSKKREPSQNPPPTLTVGTLGSYTVAGDSYGKKIVLVEDKGRTIHIKACNDDGEVYDEAEAAEILTWRSNKKWVRKGHASKEEPGCYNFDGVAKNILGNE